MDALPPHRDMDDTVQLAQGTAARQQHPLPDHRADPEQPDLICTSTLYLSFIARSVVRWRMGALGSLGRSARS